MNTIPAHAKPMAVNVVIDESMLRVDIADGREIAVPLEWFPRLRDASPEERACWRLMGGGEGIHWPHIDEDISVVRLFAPLGSLSAPSTVTSTDTTRLFEALPESNAQPTRLRHSACVFCKAYERNF